MNHKAYYQKPDGNFFLARNDDSTRATYAAMGFKITDRTVVPAIVMTPRIEVVAKPSKNLLQKFRPKIESTIPKSVLTLIEAAEKSEKIEYTASDLLDLLSPYLSIKMTSRQLSQELFSAAVVKELSEHSVSVTRRKSNGAKLLVISADGGMA